MIAPLMYRFGEYRIDRARREIFKNEQAVAVSAKAFDCIVYLLANRNRAVGRDELISAVWGKTDVADTQLNFTLFKARHAIGDRGGASEVIRTIQRFGYRWVAPVTDENLRTEGSDDDRGTSVSKVAGRDGSEKAQDESALAERSSSFARKWVVRALIAVTVSVALLVGTYWRMNYVRMEPNPANPAAAAGNGALTLQPNAKLIAVMPARVQSEDDWKWLHLGLMELVSGRLRAAHEAVVPSGNMIALDHENDTLDTLSVRVKGVTGAQTLIQPSALKVDAAWTVRLTWLRSGESGSVEAHANDVVSAARLATDRLLQAVGDKPSPESSTESSMDAWYAQTEAMLLSGDLDGVNQMLGALPSSSATTPEIELLRARTELKSGEFDGARRRLSMLLPSLPSESMPTRRGRTLLEIGTSFVAQDNGADAQPIYAEAIPLLQGSNDAVLIARGYKGRGAAFALQGRGEDAAADFARARVAYAAVGDALGMAEVEYNEALLDILAHRPVEALPVLENAINSFKSVGTIDQVADAQYCLVNTRIGLLQASTALDESRGFIVTVDRVQDAQRRLKLEYLHARAVAENGRLTEARSLFEALARSKVPGQPWHGLAQASLAAMALDADDGSTALSEAQDAVASIEGPDYAVARAYAWLTAIRARRSLDRKANLSAETKALARWCASVPDDAVHIVGHVAEAEDAWATHDKESALRLHEEALSEAKQINSPNLTVAVVNSYAKALLAADRIGDAATVIGQVARWANIDFTSAVLQVRLYRALNQAAAWQAALEQARSLAGERRIPPDLTRLASSSEKQM